MGNSPAAYGQKRCLLESGKLLARDLEKRLQPVVVEFWSMSSTRANWPACLGCQRKGSSACSWKQSVVAFLPAVDPLFDQLQLEAGFWVGADLRANVLRSVGENAS